jgi:hypothetical protein
LFAYAYPALLLFIFPYTRVWIVHNIIVATIQGT